MGKEFDVEQIEGYDLMNEEEKGYFEKYGEEINNQADLVAEENDVNPEEQIEFALMMNSLSSARREYIVDGAPLECNMQEMSENTQKFKYKGTVIKSVYIENEEDSKLMIQEMRAETINDKVPANITDTKGGLRDSLRIGKNKLNIISFGNCKYANGYKNVREMAGRLCIELPGMSVDILEEKIKDAIMSGCGTCYCLMMLNPEWENMPLGYNWCAESFESNFPNAGASNTLSPASYQQYNGKEGINMMSMLFCKCGGIINALESGQTMDETKLLIKNVLETLGWPVRQVELYEIKKILKDFGIVNRESIICFLLICRSETGAIGLYSNEIGRDGKKYVDEYERAVTEYYPEGRAPGYTFEERGVTYMHVTGKETQLACLKAMISHGYSKMIEDDIDENALGYVDELRSTPWAGAAWRWAEAKQTESGNLNNYVVEKVAECGEKLTLGIFLVAECFVNGKVSEGKNPAKKDNISSNIVPDQAYNTVNKALGAIARNEVTDWYVEGGKLHIEGWVYEAPNNWALFEENYNTLVKEKII